MDVVVDDVGEMLEMMLIVPLSVLVLTAVMIDLTQMRNFDSSY